MSHTALARKYRPTRFADLVAQAHVAGGLAGAVASNRVAHGYLLTGPRGVGKTTAARILAMALNCEQRSDEGATAGEPCGSCDSCRRIWSGSANLDVVEIDAASNRGVDDARDLRERAMYAASGPERYKVYIVDEAHMLTREAWNALLKILEEPPSKVVFVFATTEPQKIANTAAPVMSRLQRFDFRRIGPQAIVERLRHVVEAEGIETEDEALRLIARVAQGGMRDALSILDQTLAFGDTRVSADAVRNALGLIGDEMFAELLDIVVEGRTEAVFGFVGRLVEAGSDLSELIGGAGELLRAVLLRILGGEPEGLSEALRETVDQHAPSLSAGDVLRMLKLLAEAEQAVRRSPNARLHVETLILEWTLLDRTVALEDVMTALAGGSTPVAPARTRDNPAPRTHAAVSRPEPAIQAHGGPPTIEAVRSHWEAVLEAAGERRRMIREALTHATPLALDGRTVVLEVADSAVHLEGLERGKAIVVEALTAVMGSPMLVEYRPTGREAGTPATDAKRLDRNSDREARLKHYRAKDPALDAMADALDLELME